jgi:hypothetical protein
MTLKSVNNPASSEKQSSCRARRCDLLAPDWHLATGGAFNDAACGRFDQRSSGQDGERHREIDVAGERVYDNAHEQDEKEFHDGPRSDSKGKYRRRSRRELDENQPTMAKLC